VHLVVLFSLELLVENTGCSTVSFELRVYISIVNLLRTSYPNCGYSKHIERNSSSASERRVWDLVAQKLATGARIAVSSL
jgi:hypothetical protein